MRTIIVVLLLTVLPFLAAPASACTNFVLDTPEGPVFGCNLDLFIPGDGLVFINPRGMAKTGFQKNPAGEAAAWTSRYGSVTFNIAGREFAFGGMNEAGLVVGSMELRAGEFPKPDARKPLTIGSWAQYVLDTCETLEEVIATDAEVRIEDGAPPVHFLISDRDGNCVSIEWIDGEFVHRVGEDLPLKAMANMPYERALAAWERGGPRWWWSNPGESAERVAAAHERCVAYDPAVVNDPVAYALDTLTRIVGAPHTKWNIVYDIAEREVWYRTATSPGIKHLDLDAFDLACDAPILMLDVNAPLAGDVQSHFEPYDFERNLAALETLCARYELGVPHQVAVDIVRHFEGFECDSASPGP